MLETMYERKTMCERERLCVCDRDDRDRVRVSESLCACELVSKRVHGSERVCVFSCECVAFPHFSSRPQRSSIFDSDPFVQKRASYRFIAETKRTLNSSSWEKNSHSGKRRGYLKLKLNLLFPIRVEEAFWLIV